VDLALVRSRKTAGHGGATFRNRLSPIPSRRTRDIGIRKTRTLLTQNALHSPALWSAGLLSDGHMLSHIARTFPKFWG
jgi:hypothetical protein